MRSRNIKPGFFKNDILAEIDPLGRILFTGLWCMADREGRLENRPKKIKAEVLPYDNCNMTKLLRDLEERKFLIQYSANGCNYIQIVNFSKHQTPHIKESESTIPAPDLSDTKTSLESLIPDSFNLIPDSSICASTGQEPVPVAPPKVKKIIDPIFYQGTYFDLTQSQYIKLRDKANGMSDPDFRHFLDSLDMYIPNHPTKYDRRADGRLKNPANILSRWLDNQTVRGSPPTSNPTRLDDTCTNHPDKRGVKTINNRWYCRSCIESIEKKENDFINGIKIGGVI